MKPVSDAQTEKRLELELKLENDIREYNSLKQGLDNSNTVTQKMREMLESFDRRLSSLESFVLPIYNSTSNLTRLHTNLNNSINHIQAYNETIGSVSILEAVILKGVSTGNLAAYLNAMNGLKEGIQKIDGFGYKSAGKATKDLKLSLIKGIQELDQLFATVLQQECDNVPIDFYESFTSELTFQAESMEILTSISTFLADSLISIGQHSNFIKIYQDLRSACMVKWLGGAHAAAKDQEMKMGYQRNTYQKGTSKLMPYSMQLINAIQSEHMLHNIIIPKAHVTASFVTTITASVDAFIEITEAVSNRYKRNAQQKKDGNDLSILIDVWVGLDEKFTNYSALLASCGKKGHDIMMCFSGYLTTVLTSIRDFYQEFTNDEIKRQQMAISSDGTVHETTSLVMNTLKRLVESEEEIDTMIRKSPPNLFPFRSFGDYSVAQVKALIEDIELKSKSYKKTSLSSVFLLNNLHYILKGFKGNSLVEKMGPVILGDIDALIKKQLNIYRSSWVPTLAYLMDNTQISDAGKILSLTAKQKETIKENFRSFNKDFDEMCQSQTSYAIPDVELRAQVIREVKSILLPLYNRFYDKYTDLDFSKNPEKYVKYTKEELSTCLDTLFDASS